MPKKSMLLILTVASCLSAGCAVNPLTGDKELMFSPLRQDIEIGRLCAPEVEKQMDGRIKDDSLQSYIDTVGQRIARISHRSGLDYHFLALNHKSVNAFALPGGYIFITRGMLEKLQTEAQLAAILAHEIAHVVARDAANRMSNQSAMGLLLMGAASAGAPGELINAAYVTQEILSLKYSREDERQADMGGLRYMVRAGYNPYGMVETMQMLETLQYDEPVEFLSTHPSPYNRVSYLTRTIQRRELDLSALKVGCEDYQHAVLDRLTRIFHKTLDPRAPLPPAGFLAPCPPALSPPFRTGSQASQKTVKRGTIPCRASC